MWREYEHPRNPDGTFRDKAGADEWMRHIVGNFFPGEPSTSRLSAEVYAGREGTDDDPDWEFDPSQETWHETEIGDGLRLTKRVSGSQELAVHHDDGTVTPLLHLGDKQARTFDRDVDFTDGIGEYDLENDYYKTAVDEYGMITHVRTGTRVIGITPNGEFKVISLHGTGANSITLDRDSMRRLTRQMREYESWGEGDPEEDEDEDDE